MGLRLNFKVCINKKAVGIHNKIFFNLARILLAYAFCSGFIRVQIIFESTSLFLENF